jgi:hypothetical protein
LLYDGDLGFSMFMLERNPHHRETSDKGWIIHIYVKERPAIRKTPATVGINTGGWVPPLTTSAAQRGELGTSC